MTPDQEIERLDQLLDRLHNDHPNTHATLRITNTSFRACTQPRWERRNWSMTDDVLAAILNGNDEQRRAAFLALLWPHGINQIEIVPGVDIIEVVVPNPATVDQV